MRKYSSIIFYRCWDKLHIVRCTCAGQGVAKSWGSWLKSSANDNVLGEAFKGRYLSGLPEGKGSILFWECTLRGPQGVGSQLGRGVGRVIMGGQDNMLPSPRSTYLTPPFYWGSGAVRQAIEAGVV